MASCVRGGLLSAACAACGRGSKTHVMKSREPAARPLPPAQATRRRPNNVSTPSLKLSGSVTSIYFPSRLAEGPTGFTLGQLALHMASELYSPRVTFFGEISSARGQTPGTGTPAVTGFNTDQRKIRMLSIRSDRLKVSFGSRPRTEIDTLEHRVPSRAMAADDDLHARR